MEAGLLVWGWKATRPYPALNLSELGAPGSLHPPEKAARNPAKAGCTEDVRPHTLL